AQPHLLARRRHHQPPCSPVLRPLMLHVLLLRVLGLECGSASPHRIAHDERLTWGTNDTLTPLVRTDRTRARPQYACTSSRPRWAYQRAEWRRVRLRNCSASICWRAARRHAGTCRACRTSASSSTPL